MIDTPLMNEDKMEFEDFLSKKTRVELALVSFGAGMVSVMSSEFSRRCKPSFWSCTYILYTKQ